MKESQISENRDNAQIINPENLSYETIMSFLEKRVLSSLLREPLLKERWTNLKPFAESELKFLIDQFNKGTEEAIKLSEKLLNGETSNWWNVDEYKKRQQELREVTSEGQFVNVLGEYSLQRIGGVGPLMVAGHSDLLENYPYFLDALTNATVTNFGAGFPPHIMAANIINIITGGTQCPPYHPGPLMEEAGKALISIFPSEKEGAKVAWFNSGGDAVSVAIAAAEKYTKMVHGENGRRKAVYFKEAYHGNIEGRAGRVTSGINQVFHQEDINSIELEFPNKPEETNPVLEEIKKIADEKKLSCVVFETTQGDGGGVTMNPDFFVELVKLSLDKKIPLIVDEVQSGFGRSGRIFNVEYLLDYWKNSEYVKSGQYPENPPFILAVAKSLTNGAVPGSAVIFPKEYAILERAEGLNTYSAHPTTLAAVLTTVEMMNPKLLEMVKQKRAIFEEVIRQYLNQESPLYEIRGNGLHLFLGIKLTEKINDLYFNDNELINWPAIKKILKNKDKFKNEDEFSKALEEAKIQTLVQIIQVEVLRKRRVLIGTVARGALRIHAPINAPDIIWQAIGFAVGETIKEIEEGEISKETLKILQTGGPSGLAER